MNTENSSTTQSSEVDQLAGETAELERLEAELAEYKDRYIRAAAEMENIRRRLEREKADLIKYGQERLFLDFLPALDSLSRALPESSPDEAETDEYLKGMRIIKRQILEVLSKHGLQAIDSKGAPFDPELHQAIQRVESSDVQSEIVSEEFAKGYLLNGRLLRAAMVSVLIPTAST